MLFSSISFLFYFLPIMLLTYFAVPQKGRNTVLLIFSLLFYAWGEPKYIILMVISIMTGFTAGLLMEKAQKRTGRRTVLVISVLLCVAGLIWFKYIDFFTDNINKLTGLSIPLLKLALPIGISFYTFQIISYLVDVYRGETGAQHNVVNFAAYVTMFPQLIAGPIVRYKDIAVQLEHRQFQTERCYRGIVRFMIGLSKKILIANVLGEVTEAFRNASEPSVGFYWLYAAAFALHLYFDFSGYSDMAIGVGMILGFEFPENFNYPFISKSVTEFWRRWHMSLGTWFRDYVYIPLGGNRNGRLKNYRNILIVWGLTGFWHGADWNYIIWGLLFAVLLMIEKAGLLEFLNKHSLLSHLYVSLIIIFSFVIFNADGIPQMIDDLKGLTGLGAVPLWSNETGYYFKNYIRIILIAVTGATPLPSMLYNRLAGMKYGRVLKSAEPAVLIAGLLLCTGFLADGSFNPFLYFRF